MKISCLLVSHNKPGLVDEAITSVIEQIYDYWELLIMDSGVLFDRGYFSKFKDDRITIMRSHETPEIRKAVAIAPWCYNNMIPSAKGDLIVYLCDDDVFYSHGFACFAEAFIRNPDWLACYSSQHHGNYDPPRQPAITGTREAYTIRGRDICRLDCQVDYLQLCHRREVVDLFDGDFWPEDIRHKHHSDGLLLEKIGSKTMIHPLPVRTGMNRRTPVSDNIPMRK